MRARIAAYSPLSEPPSPLRFSCNQSVFSQPTGELQTLLYAKQTSEQSQDIEALFEDTRIWIKAHMVEDKLELGVPC